MALGWMNKGITTKQKEFIFMTNNVMSIKNRIHLLEMRDPVANQNIIRKLKRKLRKLEE